MKRPFCPECDGSCIKRRVGSDLNSSNPKPTRWYCTNCREGFDEPHWREPRGSSLSRQAVDDDMLDRVRERLGIATGTEGSA